MTREHSPPPTEHDLRVDRMGVRARQLLDAGADELSPRMRQRLSAARAVALARQRQALEGAPAPVRLGATLAAPGPWRTRLGVAFSALVLAVGLAWLDHQHQEQLLKDTVDIDMAILSDDLPFTAHLDPLYPEVLRREQ